MHSNMRCLCLLMIATAYGAAAQNSPAQQATPSIDIAAYFASAVSADRAGIARKTSLVDARPAREGEVVVTVIKGEGKETQSQPASSGDMVVRNRCPETGNEEILVAAKRFPDRYEGPVGTAAEHGWAPYRPKGSEMRYVIVAPDDGTFSFTAPWGEAMIARPGDAIVQDPATPKDTYRIAKAAFACTYEVVRAALH